MIKNIDKTKKINEHNFKLDVEEAIYSLKRNGYFSRSSLNKEQLGLIQKELKEKHNIKTLLKNIKDKSREFGYSLYTPSRLIKQVKWRI